MLKKIPLSEHKTIFEPHISIFQVSFTKKFERWSLLESSALISFSKFQMYISCCFLSILYTWMSFKHIKV